MIKYPENVLQIFNSFLGWGEPESLLWIICTEEAAAYSNTVDLVSRANTISSYQTKSCGRYSFYFSNFSNDRGEDARTYDKLKELLKRLKPDAELGIKGNFYMNLWSLPDFNKNKDEVPYEKWFVLEKNELKSRIETHRVSLIVEAKDKFKPSLVLLMADGWEKLIANSKKVTFRENNSGVQIFLPNIVVAYHPAQRTVKQEEWVNDIIEASKIIGYRGE